VTKCYESEFPQTLSVCFGDDQFLVVGGSDEHISLVGKYICAQLNGKGGGGGGKGRPFQGKFPKENLSESVLSVFKTYLTQISTHESNK
jgi:hypothetical protein